MKTKTNVKAGQDNPGPSPVTGKFLKLINAKGIIPLVPQ